MATEYEIHLDDKVTVNDSAVRLGVDGEFHWHKHELEDEFFLAHRRTVVLMVEPAAVVPTGD